MLFRQKQARKRLEAKAASLTEENIAAKNQVIQVLCYLHGLYKAVHERTKSFIFYCYSCLYTGGYLVHN
jgi:hypothetical protein